MTIQKGKPGRDVEVGPHRLGGILHLPPAAQAVVLFAHGSGSSRFSPRNTYVAEALRAAGMGTLLFDLLTEDEEANRANVFDIGLLADRLQSATAWVQEDAATKDLGIGYFGASTGAAAALVAAARLGDAIGAIVSRGGRPDLAEAALPDVRAPTLLIVGGYDTAVIEMNRFAYARLSCEKALRIVPAATHLFEEPGKLDAVIVLARQWFLDHLTR
jgi:putative phosphoribosyl transferase